MIVNIKRNNWFAKALIANALNAVEQSGSYCNSNKRCRKLYGFNRGCKFRSH